MKDLSNSLEPSTNLMWLKPRQMVRYLDRSPVIQFFLMVALALLYFIQASLFILSLEKITIAPLLSFKGLCLVFWSMIALGSGLFTAIYLLTFVIWAGTKCFNGQGSLPQTRAAIVWTFATSMPLGFFLLLIHFTIRLPDQVPIPIIIRIISYLAFLANLMYGFVILIITISEMHRLRMMRALGSVILGVLMLATILTTPFLKRFF